MIPVVRVEMIFGTSASTFAPALSAPDLSTPTLVSQPSALVTPSDAWREIGSCCAVMPPITSTRMSTAIATRPRRTSTAAAARGMCRARRETTGIATVAMIVAATTGPPIV